MFDAAKFTPFRDLSGNSKKTERVMAVQIILNCFKAYD